jgi:AcrR family transcriptional regulator
MVQKSGKAKPDSAKRPRGRPRGYDPEVALADALDVFWKDGFAGTSLDDLSEATGMNRPSLYGAFGDKRELYLKSYEHYRALAREKFAKAVTPDMPLRELLQKFFAAALDLYTSGKDGPRGCFSVMTTASEAIFDPVIREKVQEATAALERNFLAIFQNAKEKGELNKSAEPASLATLAVATIHTLALRARTKVPRRQLDGVASAAVDVLCARAR